MAKLRFCALIGNMRWLFFCILLLFTQTCYAGLTHDSGLTWVTAESAHFRIHYHDGEQKLAEKALSIAESVYQRLTPIFDWYPKEKTELVLSDETDLSNGFATPLPSNRITLFASSPNRVNSLEDHADWFETLILHEFVHTLHLDKARGSAKNMRNIFGRVFLLFPNVFMPSWMHEGLATYYETDKGLGIGRGQSSYFQMMMRMEVESGVKPLRQINQPMVTWPLLTSWYLYGVYFEQFIADVYGPETIQKLIQSYSDHLMPFRINDLYEDVLGKDLSQVWYEFDRYEQQQFQPQLVKLKQQGLVQGHALTQTGDFKRSVIQGKDKIFFVSDNLETGSQLMVMKQQDTKALHELNRGASMDWHGSSGLLIAQPEMCNNANKFFDLYHMDEHTGKVERLTRCQRYIAATWSPDGKQIMAVKNFRGQHALHLLDARGEKQAVLWQGKHGETLSGLDWSEDGHALVSSVWRESTGWDLEEFDLNTKTWSKLTNDMLIQTQARYVSGTRDIVFSMDKGDVYNIYQLQRTPHQIMQLTSALGGAFSPFITKDGTLLGTNYSSQGFDVFKLDQPMNKVVVGQKNTTSFAATKVTYPHINIIDPTAYSPWDSLMPTSWLPSFFLTNEGAELGAFVFGTDVLNRHSYSLYAGYQTVTSTPVFTLDYVYDRWLPLLKLYAQKRQIPSMDQAGDLIALTENTRLDAELVFPVLQEEERWSAHLGFTHQTSDVAWLHPAYVATRGKYKDTLAGAALLYDTRSTYARAISNASSGRLWSTLYESGAGLGGFYKGSVATLSGREYFDLGQEQVLALRLDMGKGSSDARAFRLGGTINRYVLPSTLKILPASAAFNRRRYTLRGYGEGEAALSGHNMGLFSAEYRFPLARIERGWMAPPLGIHQIFGQVFVDAGRAWDTFKTSKTYVGTGMELGADAILFYNLPLRMQLGYAKGLDDKIGGSQVYFRLGSMF